MLPVLSGPTRRVRHAHAEHTRASFSAPTQHSRRLVSTHRARDAHSAQERLSTLQPHAHATYTPTAQRTRNTRATQHTPQAKTHGHTHVHSATHLCMMCNTATATPGACTLCQSLMLHSTTLPSICKNTEPARMAPPTTLRRPSVSNNRRGGQCSAAAAQVRHRHDHQGRPCPFTHKCILNNQLSMSNTQALAAY